MVSDYYKILVIDDDLNVHKILKGFFGKKNIIMKSIFQPEEILSVNFTEYDAVLLDYYFKGRKKTGLDILKEIRNINLRIRIILLTGYNSEVIALEAIRYNIDNYFVKPINFKEMTEHIYKSISGNRPKKINNSISDLKSVKEFEIFRDFIILKNFQLIFGSDSWLGHKEINSSYKKIISEFFSNNPSYSDDNLVSSLNEVYLNGEKLLFYKKGAYLICLIYKKNFFPAPFLIYEKKIILNNMEKILEYVSTNTNLEQYELSLDIKSHLLNLIKSFNRTIISKISSVSLSEIAV
jgi:ActR/RegA family two-component response regulator